MYHVGGSTSRAETGEQALTGWCEGNIFNVFEGLAARVSRGLTHRSRFKVQGPKAGAESRKPESFGPAGSAVGRPATTVGHFYNPNTGAERFLVLGAAVRR